MRRLALAIVALLLATALPAAAGTGQPGSPSSGSPSSSSRDQDRNDSLSFTRPLLPPRPTATARTAAAAHLAAHSAEWGLDGVDLAYSGVTMSVAGGRTVRFTQQVGGVPVLGSLVSMTLGPAGELISLTTHTSSAPTVPVRMSQDQALAAVHAVTSPSTTVTDLRLTVADRRLLAALPPGPHYVWVAVVTGWRPFPEQVYLSDATGELVAHASTARDAVDTTPLVCDQARAPIDLGNAAAMPLCSQATTRVGDSAWVGTAGPIAVDDLTRVTSGIAATRAYFSTYIKAAPSDAAGIDVNSEQFLGNVAPNLNYGYTYDETLPNAQACHSPTVTAAACTPRMSAFVNVCVSGYACPYFQNAFWIAWPSTTCASNACSAMYFGAGWGVDDIAAHELTHGVTSTVFSTTVNEETNALSEAYSDFIAEAVDQLTVDPGELADPTWGFGEDVGYSSLTRTRRPEIVRAGPFRTMAGLQPGEYQTIGSGWDRTADAHYNLGPANRFAWLVSNGGTQGGWTIRALGTEPRTAGDADGLCDTADECTGMIRMTQLVMAALPKLTEAATYFDFGRAVIQACSDLTTLAVTGFTSTSCGQVKNALVATRIWRVSPTGLTALSARSSGVPSVVRARVLTSTGAPIQGVRVSLQYRRRTSQAWRTYETRTSNSSGGVRFSVTFSSSTYYRVVTKSSATVPYATSTTKRVIVR